MGMFSMGEGRLRVREGVRATPATAGMVGGNPAAVLAAMGVDPEELGREVRAAPPTRSSRLTGMEQT